MISFERIEFFLGLAILIPLVIIFVAVLRWKKKVKAKLGDAKLINLLTREYGPRQYVAKFVLLMIALTMGILALVNFRTPFFSSDEKKAGIDVMIALDVSKSMLCEDAKPSRLEKARQFTQTLLDQMTNNRIGLVLFAGQAYLQMPLTDDITAAKLFVSNATPNAVPVQGTVIGDALQLCDKSLDNGFKKFKAVVLISDGEDHDPKASEMVRQLKENGITVFTIGVGSPEGSPIKEPGSTEYKLDAAGKMILTRLNEKELKNIATQTGGEYTHLDHSTSTANDVAKMLASIDKRPMSDKGGARQYASLFPFFIILLVLLLIAEIFIPEVKKR
ncbi:membrane protein [Filimonas zeae]|uniref:Membrane protein n=1 Tax=Filimonas zeae TaxID=1737353 RepID=A0A917J4B4_9BACT|nr:membrane protein [Filimonas zeae]